MKQYFNILKVAHAFAIPYSIMKNCVSRKISQVKAQELVQNLSNAKKKTLIQWITHLTIIRFPASPKLVLKITEKIHQKHLFLTLQILFGFLKLHLINYN